MALSTKLRALLRGGIVQLTLSRRLVLIFAVLIATNLAVGTLLWRAATDMQAANRSAVETTGLVQAVADLSAAFEAEQGTMRGYVISADPAILRSTEDAAERTIRSHHAAIAASDDYQIRSMLEMMMSAIRSWQVNVRDPQIEMMGVAGGVHQARELEHNRTNTEYIEQVRLIIEQISGRAEWLALRNADTVEASASQMRMAIVAGFVALLILGAAFGIHAVRTISTPIRHLTGQMRRLAEGDTEFAIDGTQRRDEIGAMAAAVEVFRENAIARARLEGEAREEHARDTRRRQRLEELIGGFREEVSVMLAGMNTNMGQMRNTAQVLTGIAEQTASRAGTVASASEEASANVQTVASAAEELAASINEISRQVNETTRFVSDATEGARETNQRVAGLADMASRIGDVISLIQDIAEQTNLLALNATIEAARAGERGRGFAVVAAEVKTLAGQTAKATDEISEQIGAIQTSTGTAVEAIQAIARRMEEVNGYATAIAAAVEQQGAATDEISRNVREAASGTKSVVENIGGLESAAGETSQSAGEVEQVSRNAAEQTERLRTVVDRFLEEVAAA